MTVEDRWAAFGERLSHLRESAGLSGKGLAERVGWVPSKVSRMQRAVQAISDADVRTWCDAVGADDEITAELLAELRAIRLEQARWKSQLRRGHQPVQQAYGVSEQRAGVIRVVETALVPGLVQTAGYARAVFGSLAALKGTHDDASAAVAARMQRQNVLYDEDKRIELLVTDAALTSPIAPPNVMAAQYDRLLALVLGTVHTVRFGIIPGSARLLFPIMHGWTILDDEVRVETLDTELVTREPDDVRLYNDALDKLWTVAAEGHDARDVLARLAGHVNFDRSTGE